MAFIGDDMLLDRIKALVVGRGVLDANTPWDVIAQDANEAAFGEIVSALSSRGYTGAQISLWDRRQEFNKDLGLFWALTEGGVAKNFDDKFIEKLDRREELKEVFITSGSEPMYPESDDVARGDIRSGKQETNDDLFREPCPPYRGKRYCPPNGTRYWPYYP